VTRFFYEKKDEEVWCEAMSVAFI